MLQRTNVQTINVLTRIHYAEAQNWVGEEELGYAFTVCHRVFGVPGHVEDVEAARFEVREQKVAGAGVQHGLEPKGSWVGAQRRGEADALQAVPRLARPDFYQGVVVGARNRKLPELYAAK